ncbi:MAG: rod shape-determining protein RodA [Sorangiineae bacterium]|nr:rod shape-determining protein RodA [Polyangiaceae bacterium]MEB2321394.1 rod shape-determining protein RodA [Sorangiineae bacterium]
MIGRGAPGTSRGVAHVDMPLLLGIATITTLGVVNLYSATSAYVDSTRHARLADIYASQIYWIAIGVVLGFVVSAIDYRHFERLAYFLYAGGLVTLGLVFVLGADIRGASRWIQLGSFSFQPSEFMKILLILVIAKYLHNDPKTEPRSLVDLVPLGALTALPVVAVMAQPDLGTSLIYLLVAGAMIAMMKIRRSSLIWLVLFAVILLPLLWKYGMHDYQKLRITSFLDPEADKTGTGWHAFQSRTAIGNGGLFGQGFMQGTQNQFGFLPDQHSDFPFAVFAEDWGFVGGMVLLSLYAFVCVWAVHIASQAKDRFGATVAVGVGAMFFWHAVFNLGMALGVLPVVGITLPLFSYGGSSAITMLMSLGFLMNVSMRR